MKYNKFFELAKEAGIEEVELRISTSYSLSISLFHSEIDNYSVEEGSSYFARGIVNGKLGTASCDVYNAEKAKFLVDEIVKNAKIIENNDPVFIFGGSEKYHKINSFSKELSQVPVEKKIEDLYALEKAIREGDPRIIEVQGVEYSESARSSTIINSKGLNLTNKSNYCVIYGAALAKEGEQVKSGYDLFLGNDYNKYSVEELTKKVVSKTVSQLGGEPCESSTYKAVLAPEVIGTFVDAYMDHASSESVQKHSSLFIGKVGEKVASRKVTIEDKPLQKGSIFVRWFDDEGVATYNKPIVKNGVLQGFLYNLTTAAKENVQSTGNGSRSGSKMSVSAFSLSLKPGKKSFEELVKDVKEGVYITEVNGIHAGMNAQSGNFSLQSSGFLIKDGKIDRPLDVITISGNLISLFNDITEVGSDVKTLLGGNLMPSVVVKKLSVGGK